MFDRKIIAKARQILGWPTAIAVAVFIAAPFWPFGIPLASTAIAFTVAVSYMFFALIGQSRYLNYDGAYKEPNPPHISIFAPLIIALQGAQYSDVGALDGHALVMTLAVLVAAFLALPAAKAVNRKYKPIYEQERHEKAEFALRRALNKVEIPAATRAQIEARAKDATTDDLVKMANSIETIGKLTPELLN